jgi:hypothetical protein
VILFPFIGFQGMIWPDYTNRCPNETTLILSVRVYDDVPACSRAPIIILNVQPAAIEITIKMVLEA